MGVRIRGRQDVAYGLDNPLQGLAPDPIISNRNPTANDSAPIGTVWVNKQGNAFFVLTSVVGGMANWANQVSGSFSNLNVTNDLGVGGDASVDGDVVISGNLEVDGGNGITVLGVQILAGAGSPNAVVTAPQGSLYLNTTGSSSSTRAYINSNGATAWVAVTTAS